MGEEPANRRATLRPVEIAIMALFSAGMIGGSVAGMPGFGSMLETAAVVTGALCVYLVVREHLWNFPIGIASSFLFLLLFWESRLFGDAGLQVFFIVLGFHGWYWWVFGGENRTELRVTRSSGRLLLGIASAVGVSTYALMVFLAAVRGSAPFLDAFTTALSLGAQYMTNAKKIESWLIWILADVIYVYLYVTRELMLTAGLYTLFLALCVAGFIQWRKSLWQAGSFEPAPHPGPPDG